MGYSADKLFQQRFRQSIEVVYCHQPVDGQEKQLNQQRLSEAVKAVLAAVLKREPTQQELLGIVPIIVKKGAV